MTSFAELALVAAFAAAAAGPSAPPRLFVGIVGWTAPIAAPAPGTLPARIAERVAEAWGVPVERVRVAADGLASMPPDAAFRLTGRGRDGGFGVLFEADGRACALRVRAGVLDTVKVAKRALAGGSRVADGDLESAVRLHWGAPLPATERPGPGWNVRRLIAAGEIVTSPAVAAPPLIAAGEPVRLVWRRGAVQVSAPGVALQAARGGDPFHVRVEGSRERRLATAVAPGTASLNDGDER